jgi:hypothetical protein
MRKNKYLILCKIHQQNLLLSGQTEQNPERAFSPTNGNTKKTMKSLKIATIKKENIKKCANKTLLGKIKLKKSLNIAKKRILSPQIIQKKQLKQ